MGLLLYSSVQNYLSPLPLYIFEPATFEPVAFLYLRRYNLKIPCHADQEVVGHARRPQDPFEGQPITKFLVGAAAPARFSRRFHQTEAPAPSHSPRDRYYRAT
jgi:hypothetical protein